MPYGFSHCANRYEESRQLSSCPAEDLLHRISALGVSLDSVVDFGAGTGFWIATMKRMGLLKKKVYAVDISNEMLNVARQRITDVEFIHGGINELDQRDLRGVDCIFLCMVAHLLDFPGDLAELSSIASRNGIPHIVVVEEVSFFYHLLAGNPHYDELIAPPIRRVMSAYIERRSKLGLGLLSEDRSAPFPMPSMSVTAWKSLGLKTSGYRFETPEDLTWAWKMSAADLVDEVQSRSFSICFRHDQVEANRIGEELREQFAGNDDYKVKQEIPFWFNVHIFEIERS